MFVCLLVGIDKIYMEFIGYLFVNYSVLFFLGPYGRIFTISQIKQLQIVYYIYSTFQNVKIRKIGCNNQEERLN